MNQDKINDAVYIVNAAKKDLEKYKELENIALSDDAEFHVVIKSEGKVKKLENLPLEMEYQICDVVTDRKKNVMREMKKAFTIINKELNDESKLDKERQQNA